MSKVIPILKPQDRGEARQLIALSALWQLLKAAKAQKDFLSWRAMGCPEAESLLQALDSGHQDPVLQRWEALRATEAAHHPVPDPLDLEARHLTLQMVEALRRAGLGEGIARGRAAEAVNPIYPATKEAIRGWRRAYPAFSPEDENRITGAIRRYGHDHQRIIVWFVGLIRLKIDPLASRFAKPIPPGH